MRLPLLIGLLVLSGSLAACSSGPTLTPPTATIPSDTGTATAPAPTSPTPQLPPDRTPVLQHYFEGLAAGTRRGIQRARVSATPGSPADLFIDHQEQMYAGARAAGDPAAWRVNTAVLSGSSVDWSTSTDGAKQRLSEFTQFEFDSLGRLVQWRIGRSWPLARAVFRIDQRGTFLGITVTMTTGYQSGTKPLQIAYRARGAAGTVRPTGYLTDGAEQGANAAVPQRLRTRRVAATPGWVVFPRSSPGGRVRFSLRPDEGASSSITIATTSD